MSRSLVLGTVFYICCSFVVAKTYTTAHIGRNTQPTKTSLKEVLVITATNDSSDAADDERNICYHPIDAWVPKIVEQHDQRNSDGSYEYRYLLSNGDIRYERAYWLPVGDTKFLCRKGYYSYPMANRHFLTVFYTADHNGYQQDSSTYSQTQPVLPRSIGVPEYNASETFTITQDIREQRSPTAQETHKETLGRQENSHEMVEAASTAQNTAAAPVTEPSTATKQQKDLLENLLQMHRQANQHIRGGAAAGDAELPTVTTLVPSATLNGNGADRHSDQENSRGSIYGTVKSTEIVTKAED